jgi:hypothetical protein
MFQTIWKMWLITVAVLLLTSATAQTTDAPNSDALAAQQAKLESAQQTLNEQVKENQATTAEQKVNDDPIEAAPPPIEAPTDEEISSFVNANKPRPGGLWNHSGAPHGLTSWKYPVAFLVDPNPKMVDGDLVPVDQRTQAVPTASGDQRPGDGKAGITVSVWNPGWPLSAQQLRMIGLAINEVGGDHPELPMNAETKCFCRVVAPIPRCACQNGESAPIPTPSKDKEMGNLLRDIENEAVRAIVKETEKYKRRIYERRPSVYSNRIQEHRTASSSLRSKRVTGEWKEGIQELARELAHPSIDDHSDVLAHVNVDDVACIDSHWCAQKENKNWVASTQTETNSSGSAAGWCVGVGRVVSVTTTGTACVRYESVHDVYKGDSNDYHLPEDASRLASNNPAAAAASLAMMKDIDYECGIELAWMTTNCSDASNVRRYEQQQAEKKDQEHALHRVQMQQAALLTQHEVERTTTVLKLLRDETLERAQEYERIQHMTKERNAKTIELMKAHKRLVEQQMNQEIANNETEGIRNISVAQTIGKTSLEQHREKIAKVIAYQKKVADDRVRVWKQEVDELHGDVAREKRVPLSEIEKRVLEIQERKKNNQVLENEVIHQEKDLSGQQEMAMELMTLQDNEEQDERNETKHLQTSLDASYERTRASIETDRQHRFQLEKENAKRRVLPLIPRPQPNRPTPQCGPTPGWLLTPDEQDDEIVRCLRPLKGNANVQETYTFLTSMFGGGTGKPNGYSSTITEGCQRMHMNVSYFDVLTRIKEREDLEEDTKYSRGSGAPRPSLTDPTRSSTSSNHPLPSLFAAKHGHFPGQASSVNPSLLLELLATSTNASTIATIATIDISKASALVGLSVNNTDRHFGPPDELGNQAIIPSGGVNFAALETATSCLCQARDGVNDGRGAFDLKRHQNIHQVNGGGCIDELDSANGMINMQWRSVVRSRIATLEHELEEARRRPKESPRPLTQPLDVAAMVKRIHVQKESLKRATNTLNNELDSRWKRGPTIHGNPAYIINEQNQHLTPVSGGGGDGGDGGTRFQSTQVSLKNDVKSKAILSTEDAHAPTTVPDTHSAGFAPVTDGSCGATLYKAWEQIKILEEEIDKLKEDLRKCRAEPDKYQPGCDEDLSFQITRLKEESERRQALIEEETLHIETVLKDATKALKTCQGQASGCEPKKEAQLRLSKKHISECVDVRKRHDHEVAWRMIYGCLWKYRGVSLIHDIETWFTVRIHVACVLFQCMCFNAHTLFFFLFFFDIGRCPFIACFFTAGSFH